MSRASLREIVHSSLSDRLLGDAGFAGRPGGPFQVDATIWGILALRACGGAHETLERLRARVAHEQRADGRVSVSRDHPDSYWPTPWAILAWQDSFAHQGSQRRAVRFLLETTGIHFPRKPDAPWAHDTMLNGWPWIDGTHSWAEPTAVCVMALRATGHGKHDRVRDAVRMLLDRQLSNGGWNYGNTLMFGKELHPMPESTGAALTGLAGVVRREQLARSIAYLEEEVGRLRTPISLGWSLLGLAAWDKWPSNGVSLVERCLGNQSRYGEYDTAALSLLSLGALAGASDPDIPLLSQDSTKQASVGYAHQGML